MKVLPKEFVVNLNSITEIKAFYENLKDLNHPNLNQIKNIYENEDNFFLIREMSDETLKTKMNNNFTPSLFEIKIIVFQLLSAVAYLHEKGYNHGNIKPENVLLFDNNTVRLNDYCHYEKFLRKTNTNSVLFSSPELIENGSMEKSDEWAIGVILYCLCCNQYPFNGNSINEINNRITLGDFEHNERFNNLQFDVKDLIFQ